MPPQPVEHIDIKISTALINSTFIDGFNIDKLGKVIHTFKNKKAAGPDELKPFVLKELPRYKLDELLFIYKSMIGSIYPISMDEVQNHMDPQTEEGHIQSF